MIVFFFFFFFAFFTFSVRNQVVCEKNKNSPPKGATHFKNGTFVFALQKKNKKIIKDNMKRSIITDQVNVFFFLLRE